jgi:hypothetical protein
MIIQEPFRLAYTFGDAYNPGNRHGSVVVQLFGDGRVLLDNAFGGAFTKSWEGVIERTTIERILAHLDAAGFPRVENHSIAPGSSLRVILVQSGDAEMHNPPIAWSAAAAMKGYADAFQILDGLCAELSEGAIRTVKLVEKGLVRRAETPSRPAVGLDDAFDLGLAPSAETIARLLQKYGKNAAPAPVDAAQLDAWYRQVTWEAEALMSGTSAEAFALARAIGAVRLALEQGSRDRIGNAFSVLRSSRHEPARQIAELSRQAAADFRPRLEALAQALRAALSGSG